MPMKNNEDEVVRVGQSLHFTLGAPCLRPLVVQLMHLKHLKVRMPRRSQKSSKVLPIARQVAKTTRK